MTASSKIRQPKSAETHDPVTRMRKPVPEEIDPNYVYKDEREEIIEMFAPDCIDKRDERGARIQNSSEFTAFFGDPKGDMSLYRRQGYIPIVQNGEQVTHRGDPLFKRARELFTKERMRSEGISRRNAEASLEAEDADAAKEGFTTSIPAGG